MINSNRILRNALISVRRRLLICKHAPKCISCNSAQVQLINPNPLATWKCRVCKHIWKYEPILKENE
jgi:hypothetical protein